MKDTDQTYRGRGLRETKIMLDAEGKFPKTIKNDNKINGTLFK